MVTRVIQMPVSPISFFDVYKSLGQEILTSKFVLLDFCKISDISGWTPTKAVRKGPIDERYCE